MNYGRDKPGDAGKVRAQVRVGDEEIAIRRMGRSASVVARILRRDTGADGGRVLLLDRLVHADHEASFESTDSCWNVSGCFVSQLEEVIAPLGQEKD